MTAAALGRVTFDQTNRACADSLGLTQFQRDRIKLYYAERVLDHVWTVCGYAVLTAALWVLQEAVRKRVKV